MLRRAATHLKFAECQLSGFANSHIGKEQAFTNGRSRRSDPVLPVPSLQIGVTGVDQALDSSRATWSVKSEGQHTRMDS